jgi:hypothetical protein
MIPRHGPLFAASATKQDENKNATHLIISAFALPHRNGTAAA